MDRGKDFYGGQSLCSQISKTDDGKKTDERLNAELRWGVEEHKAALKRIAVQLKAAEEAKHVKQEKQKKESN